MDSHYYHHDNHLKRHKYIKRARWFGWGAFISILILVSGIAVYLLFFVKAETPGVTSGEHNRVVANPISVFRSPYFQFEASDGWVEIQTGRENFYLYRSTNNGIAEHDLQITVKPKEIDFRQAKATRVFVVNPGDGLLNPIDDVSESCSEAGPDINDMDVVTFMDATFTCTAGGALFDVLVAEKNGTPKLTILRPDGESVELLMYYRDLRAIPDGRELKKILSTFQAR